MSDTAQVTVLRRPFRFRPAYRVLKRTFLPRPFVHGLLSAAKRLTVRDQIRQRAALARQLGGQRATGIGLVERDACQLFTPDELPGALEAARHCSALFEACRASGADSKLLQRNPHKAFLLSIVAANEFAKHPELLRFAVSRPLLDAATHYLGTVPVLEGIALWWTPPNESTRSSQTWHIDELAPRQVKILLNCLEVTADSGPLHFIPAAVSERCRQAVGHRRGRLADELIERSGCAGHVRRATGPAGSGIIFDSSRCLHFGSRGNRRDRLVLTFHYLPLDAPTETRYRLALPALPGGCENLDAMQRLALGFAPQAGNALPADGAVR